MQKLYLDTTALTQKADRLEELDEQLLQQIRTLDDTEATLAGMWEGPAKEAFRRAYHRDSVQMKNFYNAIRAYAYQLRVIINAYKLYEVANTDIASQRSYCGC